MRRGDEASRHPTASLGKAIHAANRVMFSIQRGDLEAAESWGRQLAAYAGDALWVWTWYAPARLLIARGDHTAAAGILRSLYERAVKADALGYAIRIRVYQALAAATADEAIALLAEALRMGEPEGFIRTFVDEGKLLRPLLAKAVGKGFTPGYVSRLLGIIDAEERGRGTPGGIPMGRRSGVLSDREQEVARLIAAGLSNRQIADRLVVTLNTAKTHVHNIAEKLNVRTRTQIAAKARELGLI